MHAVTEPTATSAAGQPEPHPPADPGGNQATGHAPDRGRLMIAVSDLIAHPGNVRQDLNLTDEFCASIGSDGVRIPLLVTTSGDGGWLVIEGHRRLAAAVKAGLNEVPCDIDAGRADDPAGQYLDMLLANGEDYRTNFTIVEEAAALFAAHEAGATRTRIRKATGKTAAQVKIALAAGSLTGETKARAAELGADLTLDQLAVLAEFDGDTEATEALLHGMRYGYSVEHTAERIRQDRAEAAEQARLRAELQTAGITVTDSLPSGAAWLTTLTHDGDALTPETHAGCSGHGATFRTWNPLQPSFYCTDPAEHGHASNLATMSPSSPGTSDRSGTGSAQPDPVPDPDRRLVIDGNKAWQAAAEVRHRWLATTLLARRAASREVHAFLARQLLAMPDPLRSGLASARSKTLFAKLTGHDASELEQSCDTTPTGRLTILAIAPLITAYETAMIEAEGRNTWRTDRYSPCPRPAAASYLTFLASLGYQLSGIEQAVADGATWTGDTPPAARLAGDTQPRCPEPAQAEDTGQMVSALADRPLGDTAGAGGGDAEMTTDDDDLQEAAA